MLITLRAKRVKRGKLLYFKALFLAVSMDIRSLLFIEN